VKPQVLELHAERRLPLAIADLGAQIGDLPKSGIGGVIVRALKLRSIESIKIVDAHDSSYPLSNAESFDCVEILDSQRRISQGRINTLRIADGPDPGILEGVGCKLGFG
jgi:hypothetical protein